MNQPNYPAADEFSPCGVDRRPQHQPHAPAPFQFPNVAPVHRREKHFFRYAILFGLFVVPLFFQIFSTVGYLIKDFLDHWVKF